MEQFMNSHPSEEGSARKNMSDRIGEMKKRHIAELRELMLKYKVMNKRENANLDYKFLPHCCNIILFGPSKSGKSSLIKTFYQALYNTTALPNEYNANLIIQKLTHTEGTKKFTKFTLKQEKKNIIQTDTTQIVTETSQINVYDTRGQILMDDKEIKQMELLIDGKVKDLSFVEQRTLRYAHLLWEFWKRDSELFPKDIMSDGSFETRPHVLLFVFDGSIEINRKEEIDFYRDILQKARSKNYFYPQIVLTKVDQVEEKIRTSLQNSNLDAYELEAKLRESIDMKIEEVVVKLGVPRETVHFIENYHEKKINQDVEIDYYALKLLSEALKQADNYLESSLPTVSYCKVF